MEQSKVTQLSQQLDHAMSSATELFHMIQQLQKKVAYNNDQIAASKEARNGMEQVAHYEEDLGTISTTLQSEKEK